MRAALIICVGLFVGCTGKPPSTDASLSTHQLNIEQFLDGDLVAYGQFQDVFGTVRRQFTVKIKGNWNGKQLKLLEDFVYEDGSAEQRVWTLLKTGAQTWTGTAAGVIGQAVGVEQGDRVNWRCTIDLPVPIDNGLTRTVRVTFDDWIWLQSDTRAFNRAYMNRYGVDIGDVSISFEKLS